MFEIIGSFLDSLLFIVGGIFLITQIKRINKPYIKWIAIIMIAVGVLLTIINIVELN